MTCGHCGCAIVAQIKKQKYIYYHCSGYKGKCPERYVRQEVFDEQFERVLGRLGLNEKVFNLLRRALKESHSDEVRERDEMRARLNERAEQLQQRLDTIYLDKVEGRISGSYHDRIVGPWRDERATVIRDLEHLNTVDEDYIDDGVALLELVTNAHKGFSLMAEKHKRRALNFVLENCTWANGLLSVEFRQPFDILEKLCNLSAAGDGVKHAQEGDSGSLVTPTGIEPVFQP